MNLDWPTAVVILAGILALCFVAMLLLVRAQRSHEFRIGVFVERHVEDADDDDDAWPGETTQVLPPQ